VGGDVAAYINQTGVSETRVLLEAAGVADSESLPIPIAPDAGHYRTLHPAERIVQPNSGLFPSGESADHNVIQMHADDITDANSGDGISAALALPGTMNAEAADFAGLRDGEGLHLNANKVGSSGVGDGDAIRVLAFERNIWIVQC